MEQKPLAPAKMASKKEMNALVAAASYAVFFLPLYTKEKNNPAVQYHMRQATGLFIAALALQGAISILGAWGFPAWRVWPVRIVLVWWLVTGVMNALKGQMKELSYIGKYAARLY